MEALIFSAASRARLASREPMMTLSPALVQRRARPKPSGPVPPSTAMERVIVMVWVMRTPGYANSGSRACSNMNCSLGILMLMRV